MVHFFMSCLNGSRLLVAVFGLSWLCSASASADAIALNQRRLVTTSSANGQWKEVTNSVSWESSATAVVICDMWDKHWCKGATARVAEMAPRMNAVVAELRNAVC